VYSGEGGLATAASIVDPRELALDSAGNLYIAAASIHRILKVNAATGAITTVAGTGVSGFGGDGGAAASAMLSGPVGVGLDATNNIFIADSSNNRIRRVDGVTGIITTVAGSGAFVYSGDGGPALAAGMRTPTSVRVDASGNLFIADLNSHHIRKVTAEPASSPMPSVPASSGHFREKALSPPRPPAIIRSVLAWTAPEISMSPTATTAGSERSRRRPA
jgi:hypothetical protein